VKLLLSCVSSAWLLAAQVAFAQQPAQKPSADPGDVPTFQAGTELVDLHVSVLDRHGKLITTIPKQDFKVYENGVEQPIKIFRREDVPVSMGILIDNSGSMRDKRARVAAAALDLVKNSNPQDEMFVVNFNDKAYIDQDFTNDTKKLESALDRIDSRGGTAMRDAISASITHLKEKGKWDKKVILVVTDGNDNTSSETMEQLVREAQRSGVLIYTIGLLSDDEPHEARSVKRALKALAQASGGAVYYPKQVADVERVTPEVAREIRNQYLLAYSPTDAKLDGTYRRIEVKVKGFGRVNVRARSGYYATPITPPASSSVTTSLTK
jgi:Ca-activated chloride channel family protein